MHEVTPFSSTRTPLRNSLLVAVIFAIVTFLIHFCSSLWASHLGYGFFRDEFYFLVCGHHLAWGYVDQPPLVAVQARIAETLFGVSPTGVRILAFAAAGVMVSLTGLMTRQFGGRVSAQVLAMTAILAAPVLLATTDFLSMNAWEPCFWMGSMFVLLRIADGSSSPRWWMLFGVIAGLGIENKHSTAFFLVALLVGLLLSPQRRLLWTKSCAAGVAILLLLAMPNFIWQCLHHFPTYVMLDYVRHTDKNIKLPPLRFLLAQVNLLLISTSPLWIGGLCWLGFGRKSRSWRFVAITYVVFLVAMMSLHAKHYYLAPIYPVLFAAGSASFGMIVRRRWPLITYAAILGLTLIFITGPIALPILPPERYNSYNGLFLLKDAKMEKFTSPLPQYLSDRFGWPEMVQGFAVRYNALPPDIRAHTAIFCDNYGEAGAVDILGRKYGLPFAISGHQNYFYWGSRGYTGDSVLTLGYNAAEYTGTYAEVIDLGPFNSRWTMDFERKHYFWLRHRKRTFAEDWPNLRFWY